MSDCCVLLKKCRANYTIKGTGRWKHAPRWKHRLDNTACRAGSTLCHVVSWRREVSASVGATLRPTALVELETRAIRALYARKDLQRDQFDIWLKSAFNCFKILCTKRIIIPSISAEKFQNCKSNSLCRFQLGKSCTLPKYRPTARGTDGGGAIRARKYYSCCCSGPTQTPARSPFGGSAASRISAPRRRS